MRCILATAFASWALAPVFVCADPVEGRIAASAPKGPVWDCQWDRYKASFAARSDLFALDYHIHGELGASEAQQIYDLIVVAKAAFAGGGNLPPTKGLQ